MPDREKIAKDLTDIGSWIAGRVGFEQAKNFLHTIDEALALLKEQEGYVSIPFSWLVKFCTHIDFKEPMSDQEREILWREKLDQQFGIGASICCAYVECNCPFYESKQKIEVK